MIPKKIHYCWFGRNPLSELTLRCIQSWKKFLPDYEIIEWNEDNFDVNLIMFTKEAYENKKFAFVSDVCRLFVLNQFGGIYLDTDMEIIKELDIIDNNMILGFEDMKYVNCGIIIAPINHVFINKLYKSYEKLSFSTHLNDLKAITIPNIISRELSDQGIVLNNKFQIINNIKIYPSDYFYPFNYFTGKTQKTNNTLTIHHYASSWLPKSRIVLNELKYKLIFVFGENRVNKWIELWRIKQNKKPTNGEII
jgi:mannosyltransferase OCH1-like enzyme